MFAAWYIIFVAREFFPGENFRPWWRKLGIYFCVSRKEKGVGRVRVGGVAWRRRTLCQPTQVCNMKRESRGWNILRGEKGRRSGVRKWVRGRNQITLQVFLFPNTLQPKETQRRTGVCRVKHGRFDRSYQHLLWDPPGTRPSDDWWRWVINWENHFPPLSADDGEPRSSCPRACLLGRKRIPHRIFWEYNLSI